MTLGSARSSGEQHRPITCSAKPNSPHNAKFSLNLQLQQLPTPPPSLAATTVPRRAGMSSPYPSTIGTETGADLQSKGEILGVPDKPSILGGFSPHPSPPKSPLTPPKHHQRTGMKD